MFLKTCLLPCWSCVSSLSAICLIFCLLQWSFQTESDWCSYSTTRQNWAQGKWSSTSPMYANRQLCSSKLKNKRRKWNWHVDKLQTDSSLNMKVLTPFLSAEICSGSITGNFFKKWHVTLSNKEEWQVHHWSWFETQTFIYSDWLKTC